MNERSWLGATRPYRMLDHLRGQATPRKLRLLGVASCQRIAEVVRSGVGDRAIFIAESYADGTSAPEDLAQASEAAGRAGDRITRAVFESLVTSDQAFRADLVVSRVITLAQRQTERGAQCELIRDIFGNPFRPVAFAPEWRTSAAVGLAAAMYAARDFGPMPVLADALEEAGCGHPDVLAHCRGDGPHVRGCWVVDLVLGNA